MHALLETTMASAWYLSRVCVCLCDVTGVLFTGRDQQPARRPEGGAVGEGAARARVLAPADHVRERGAPAREADGATGASQRQRADRPSAVSSPARPTPSPVG